jgi:flagellar hook-length control protein FliK
MMVATGLPITSAPSQGVTAPNTEAPGTAGVADGGFLGTLLQMLGLQEPAAAIGSGVTDLLADVVGDEASDASAESSDADLVAPLVVPAVLPLIQSVEIRSAQLLVRGSGDGAANGASGTVDAGPATSATTAAASDDVTRQLLSLLKDSAADWQQGSLTDATAQTVPTGTLQGPGQETSLSRSLPAEVPVPRQLHAHVGTPAWSDELGAQLHLLAEKGHSAASLRLSPEHLGPLEVQISVQDNEATVWFGATNVDTRAALEQALPRLRELFAAQGMSLTQSGVFNQSTRDSSRHAGNSASGGSTADATAATEAVPIALSRRGLVDTYA